MNGHLITVKVRIEGGADQGVDLDRFAFDEDRLKGLNAKAVKGGGAIQEYRMFLDDFLQDVPNHRLLAFHHFFGGLDSGAEARLLEPVINEGLEKLESHLLRQTALMKFQLRPHNDNRAPRVVDALTEQILPEASLLALERIGQRLERAVVGASQHPAASTVVEECVHSLLQHPLLVAHDDVGRVQLHQLLQSVVPIDHTAIKIVQVGGGKTAAVEWNQGPQLRRDHRD